MVILDILGSNYPCCAHDVYVLASGMHLKVHINMWICAVADLRGQVEVGVVVPLHVGNSVWCPLFVRTAPPIMTLSDSFLLFWSEFRATIQVMSLIDRKTKEEV